MRRFAADDAKAAAAAAQAARAGSLGGVGSNGGSNGGSVPLPAPQQQLLTDVVATGIAVPGYLVAAAAAAAASDAASASLSSTAAASSAVVAAAAAAAASLSVLTEKARHVVGLLRQLHVAPAVMDAAVLQLARPQLRPWLDVARARRRRSASASSAAALAVAAVAATPPPSERRRSSSGGGGATAAAAAAAERKEQTHLLALYGALCECAGSGDAAVREAASVMLLQVGRELGLMDQMPPLADLCEDV